MEELVEKQNLVTIASEHAIKCHRDTNHLYDGQPYEVHLKAVADTASYYSYLIPDEYLEIVFGACWCHDVIEDCRENYNSVKKICGEEVANIVYACTNEKGKNRKERANFKYYEGIRSTPFATFVKLCDRIANIAHGYNTDNRMLDLYRKENDYFKKQLYMESLKPMFDKIEELLK